MTADLCRIFWPVTGHILDKFLTRSLLCEALIKSSPVKACSSGHAVLSSKAGSDPTLSDTSISQQVINMHILSQLQSLGRRLDNMEAKNCKKTSMLQKDCMPEYLVSLLDDAQDFSWEVAKASHPMSDGAGRG